MGFFSSINIASTGLSAQRLRMDVISDNIANAETTRKTNGEIFRRKRVIMSPRADQPVFKMSNYIPHRLSNGHGKGVRVTEIMQDMSPPNLVFDPDHPDAYKIGKNKGYVAMPNVNIVNEMVDMIDATRSYEANLAVVNSSKSMFQATLSISRSA